MARLRTEARDDFKKAMIKVIRDDYWMDFIELHYALDESGQRMKGIYWGVEPSLLMDKPPDEETQKKEAKGGISLDIFLTNGALYFSLLPKTIYPWYLWPLSLLGIWAFLSRDGSNLEKLYKGLPFISLFGTSLTIGLFMFVVPRHHLFLIPALAFLTSEGICLLGQKFGPTLDPPSGKRLTLVLFLTVMGFLALSNLKGLLAFHSAESKAFQDAQSYERFGLKMKDLAPPEARVMAFHPAPVFYAQREWLVMPFTSLRKMVKYALAKGCDFIAISRDEDNIFHYLKELNKRDRDFVLLELTGLKEEGLRGDRVSFRPKLDTEALVLCEAIEADRWLAYAGGAEGHYQKGKTLIEGGEGVEGVLELFFALELDPEHVQSHILLGQVYRIAGYKDLALREWQEALKIEPKNALILHYLAILEGRDK